MRRLILAGGGHAHLSVLRALARKKPADLEVLLITPGRYQNYSGMLPGWMAGHYTKDQCQIDLQPLAHAAHAHRVDDSIAGMDADSRYVCLKDGRQIKYDLLSLDIGSETNTSWLGMMGEKLLPVKPLDAFFDVWPKVLATAKNQSDYPLLVVGGGAAGVELALAAQHAFTRAKVNGSVALVVADEGVMVGHAAGVKRRVLRHLTQAGIMVHRFKAVGTQQGVLLSNGSHLPAGCVIAATGARAPGWLQGSGLLLDENGYISVNGHHRSLSHTTVFAAGDVCARQDVAMARSGVHAVYAGKVLAENLLAVLHNGSMKTYRPRRRSLYLLACGSQYAIASWGGISAEGRWVWRWKDRIDQGFIKRFSDAA